MRASNEGGAPKDPKGLYAALGVSPTADATEIRKAYRKQALQSHPDKNPDDPTAQERFQKIGAAYEVLSDENKRHRYDTTGCMNEEEMESTGMDHFEDLFNFLFQGFSEELDPEEELFFADLLNMHGSSSGRRGRRGKKAGRKGAGRRKGQGASSGSLDEQLFNEVFGGFVGGASASSSGPRTLTCPQGHSLKKRKSDEVYECDVCESDIPPGKRFHDCRKCNFSVCLKCGKEMEAALEEEDDDEEDDFLRDFCEEHSTEVVKDGQRQWRCGFCKTLLPTQNAVQSHMEDVHCDQLEAAIMEMVMMAGEGGGLPGAGFPGAGFPGAMFGGPGGGGLGGMGGMGGLEAMLLEEMLGGGGAGGGWREEANGRPSRPKAKGSKKKR